MKEWITPYNPFNSMKILMWSTYLKACVEGKQFLIPPMVDLDLSPHCNMDCGWCNSYDIIDNNANFLPTSHYIKVVDFLSTWGKHVSKERVRSVCVAGGGEGLLHPGYNEIIESLYQNKIAIGVITNGVLLDDKKIAILARACRWVGISVDAATSETFNQVKGIKGKLFRKVCENIKKLTKKIKELGVTNDVGFKFLLSPSNYKEIYGAIRLAKYLGVRDFHLRPVGYLNIPKLKGQKIEYTVEMLGEIEKQLQEARKMETPDFRIYGITHKFNPDFQPKKNFKKCWCIPMLPTFGADGKVHMCFDMRNKKDFIMCNHYPDPWELARFWNSEKHKQMVANINIEECPRCTFSGFNETVEQVFIKDGMCRDFL